MIGINALSGAMDVSRGAKRNRITTPGTDELIKNLEEKRDNKIISLFSIW